MYLLQKITGNKFNRINSIIDSYNYTQNNFINLIACVCYIFPEVIEAMKFPLSTLPTEGLMNNRYFPTYDYMERIEVLSQEQALKLFKISSGYKVNIQPHSGTQANHIIYNAILKDGDRVISMSPFDGGHISHTKLAGRKLELLHFYLNDDYKLDYNLIENMIMEFKPTLLIAGVSSYPREIDFQLLSQISHKHNCYILADISHTAIFVAGEVHKNVFPYVDFATFTMEKNLRGPHGGVIIYKEKFHKAISYSTFPISQGGPIQNMLFGKLVAFELLNQTNVKEYANRLVSNARSVSKTLLERGCDVVTSGTDSHIILVNTKSHGLLGNKAENILEKNRILVNRNLIPKDKEKPLITSGIRIGSTTITNLNYEFVDVINLSNTLADVLLNRKTDEHNVRYLLNKYHSSINISSEETK